MRSDIWPDIAKAAKDSTYKPKLISTGKGRTTWVIFWKDEHIYTPPPSPGEEGDDCPPPFEIKGKYLYHFIYDIFLADRKGNVVSQLTNSKVRDAGVTVSPNGDKIILPATAAATVNYGPWDDGKTKTNYLRFGLRRWCIFSPDGKKLVFRSSRPQTDEEVNEYKDLLSKGLVAPPTWNFTPVMWMAAIWNRQNWVKTNWAPFYHPAAKDHFLKQSSQQTRIRFSVVYD